MTFQPLGARILVRPDKMPDKVGNIIIPDKARTPSDTGVVAYIGPGMLKKDGTRWPMPPGVEVGSRVVFESKAPYPRVKIDNEDLLSMRDDDLLAVIEP